MQNPKTSVLGLGVGYALAVVLAEAGLYVTGIDINPAVVKNPRVDPSVRNLLAARKDFIEERLSLSSNLEDIRDSDVVIICVSTGDEKELVLGNVEKAVRETLDVLKSQRNRPLILIYSTLPFGSSARIRNIFDEMDVRLDEEVLYCYMPLMIAGGTYANDFVNPPFLVFGAYNTSSANIAKEFYVSCIKRSSLYTGREVPSFIVKPEEAELIKLAANAFLATKMSFANTIASLCERLGLDGEKVLEAIGSHPYITGKHLKAGFAFSGNCFPRDLASLIQTFRENAIEPRILDATQDVNIARLFSPLAYVSESGSTEKSVIILGRSYKSRIADTRGSYAFALGKILEQKGFQVNFYDPNIDVDKKLKDVRLAPIIIVLNDEQEFSELGKYLSKDVHYLILDYACAVKMELLPDNCSYFKASKGWLIKRF